MTKNIIIDFDSTIVSVEAMEFIFDLCLSHNPDRLGIMDQVVRITNAGMTGEIPFSESLRQRVALLPLERNQLGNMVDALSRQVSASFVRNAGILNSYNLHVVSGGFEEVITPILNIFQINPTQIHANRLVFEGDQLVGVDESRLLSQDQGKVAVAKSLALEDETVVVGDGYTDYEVYKENYADYFVYYAEHVKRDQIMKSADSIAYSFDDVVAFIENDTAAVI